MTDVEAVRERLAQMRALCEAALGDERSASVPSWRFDVPAGPKTWTQHFTAAAFPDLMLRLVTEAEGVLDRHVKSTRQPVFCRACRNQYPCSDVEAVLRAWTS